MHEPASRLHHPQQASPEPTATAPRSFRSILFPQASDEAMRETQQPPEFFHDLNLDQVVNTITANWDEFDLSALFYTPLKDVDSIVYRQEVMRDLEEEATMAAVQSFNEQMRIALRYLKHSQEVHYKEQSEGWFLESARLYCEAVQHLTRDLKDLPLQSRGLQSLREFLATYVRSSAFEKLFAETKNLTDELSAIRYCLVIKGNHVTVRNYDGEEDYSVSLEETFKKFRRGEVKDYRRTFKGSGMNHVEARILERVAWLNPRTFDSLEKFRSEHAKYPHETILRFYREIHFYIAYLDYMNGFRHTGLSFCYPQVSDEIKEEFVQDAFDPALAYSLIGEQRTVVPNGFYLNDPERIIVVSGPNQGGKTTFARMFGQLHYLASLGCPVPGSQARLFLFDHLFTHFEREEDITNLRSKLEDDLVRMRRILERATPNSIIIMNEVFSSTTIKDSINLSKKVLKQISQLDLLCVFVTFLDELASFNEKTVSMVSTVDPEDPAIRTYHLERRPADGLAYAIAIAQKHRVTYEQLKGRINK